MKKAISVILAAVVLIVFLPLAVYAEETTHIEAKINKNGRYVEITGGFSKSDVDLYKGRTLQLYGVSAGNRIGDEPAIEKDVKARTSVSLQTPVRDAAVCAYVIGYEDGEGGYVAVTNYAYIQNPDALASETYERPAVRGKKGLNTDLFADAQLLGVSHAVIDLPINEYIKTGTSDATVYKTASGTYYFDKALTSLLEYRVKTYTDAGIRVYFRLLLTPSKEDQAGYLYFPDADQSARYFTVNTNSKQACDVVYAFVSYLAEKFSGAGRTGFAADYIVGYEVNSNRYTNNAGAMSVSEYTEIYSKLVRIVDSASRSVYSGSRVYVPFANNFTKPSSDNNADPTLDYSLTDLLSHLSSHIKNGGDIPYEICVDPYNIERGKADFKDAEGSEYSYDAKYVTMDNINILTSLLSQPAYMYDGQRRRVLIGEVSYSSGSGSADEQRAQAAAFALAYYKAEANGEIEAIIYGRHVDRASDGDNFGLYTRVSGTENTADQQKTVYRVFRYIDTDYSSVITEPFLSYYGIVSWGEAVSGYSSSDKTRAKVISGAGTTDDPGRSELSLSRITDFNNDELLFYPSENARMITTEKNAELSSLYGSEYSLIAELNMTDVPEYRGVSANGGFDIGGAEYAVIDMKLEGSVKNGISDVMFVIKGRDGDGGKVVYEGISAAEMGQNYRIYFDISEFVSSCPDEAERISVWVKPHTDADNGEYKLFLNGVSFLKRDGKAKVGSVVKTVIIVLIIAAVTAAAAYGIMYLRAYIIYRKKKKKIEAKRRKKQIR